MYDITVKDVNFSYGSQNVLHNVNLTAEPGDFVCLLGPSGCGKSTLLRLIAGLDKPSDGTLTIDGTQINGPGLDRGVVFQDYSLFPWMSAKENISLALAQAFPGKKRTERNDLSSEFLDLVGLGSAADKLPKELSGGMRQRAAIALAFAINSPVLLMDEPFGALDAITRVHLQDLLLQLWHQNGRERKTVIFVTHDVEEALLLANKIAVFSLNPGTIKTVVPVDLPRPRLRQHLFSDDNFQTLRSLVLNQLHDSVLSKLDAEQTAFPSGDRI